MSVSQPGASLTPGALLMVVKHHIRRHVPGKLFLEAQKRQRFERPGPGRLFETIFDAAP
jgi:hypothetical protein